MLFCRAFIMISRTGQNLEASMPNLHSPKLSGGKSTADVAGKRQIWSNIDNILTIFSTGWNTWLRLVSDVALFVPLFDALAQIPWLSKSPKVFSKPGLILGPKWVPHLASFPGEDPEDPWANQWWQCSKRTSGSFHSFHLWHWQISTCHNLFATYSQFCALEHSWTDLNGQSLISLAVKWDSSRTRRTLVCHVMFSLGITVHPKVCWWRTVGAEKAHEFHGVSPGPTVHLSWICTQRAVHLSTTVHETAFPQQTDLRRCQSLGALSPRSAEYCRILQMCPQRPSKLFKIPQISC